MKYETAVNRATRDAKIAKAPTLVLHFSPYDDVSYGAALDATYKTASWNAQIVAHVSPSGKVEIA